MFQNAKMPGSCVPWCGRSFSMSGGGVGCAVQVNSFPYFLSFFPNINIALSSVPLCILFISFTYHSWRRKWQPTPVFLPGESHGQKNLAGYSPQSCKESKMTGVTNTYLSIIRGLQTCKQVHTFCLSRYPTNIQSYSFSRNKSMLNKCKNNEKMKIWTKCLSCMSKHRTYL